MAAPSPPLQLELDLHIAPDVRVTRYPDGEVRLRPAAPLLTGGTRDAALALGTSRKTVIRLIHAGELRAWRPGKQKMMVDMTSVYDYRDRRRV